MFPMEDDDIFQVDKADLIQGPTLAELNANDESLLTDFNFDDFVMPSQATGRNINRPINRPDVFTYSNISSSSLFPLSSHLNA